MKSIEEMDMELITGGFNCFFVGLFGWIRAVNLYGTAIQVAQSVYCWNT